MKTFAARDEEIDLEWQNSDAEKRIGSLELPIVVRQMVMSIRSLEVSRLEKPALPLNY